jgi:hypothetical protein
MLKKQCDRCQSLMLEEKIKLTSESLEQRFLSAYHCIYCGRMDGTANSTALRTHRLLT